MSELLLELFSEEIPARLQARAAEDLRALVTGGLAVRGLPIGEARAFATPRRLALHIAGLPIKGQDVREERKGPRVGAPEAAIQGFLKASGLASIDQATIQSMNDRFTCASGSCQISGSPPRPERLLPLQHRRRDQIHHPVQQLTAHGGAGCQLRQRPGEPDQRHQPHHRDAEPGHHTQRQC
jgi:hypothetical protein